MLENLNQILQSCNLEQAGQPTVYAAGDIIII